MESYVTTQLPRASCTSHTPEMLIAMISQEVPLLRKPLLPIAEYTYPLQVGDQVFQIEQRLYVPLSRFNCWFLIGYVTLNPIVRVCIYIMPHHHINVWGPTFTSWKSLWQPRFQKTRFTWTTDCWRMIVLLSSLKILQMFWIVLVYSPFFWKHLLRNHYKRTSLAVFNAAKVAYIRTSIEIQSNEVVWIETENPGRRIGYLYTDFPEMMSPGRIGFSMMKRKVNSMLFEV